VGDLVEAVAQRLRADPDRLEEDVVLGVAGDEEVYDGREGESFGSDLTA
jgi:hypothetical protein